MTLLILHLLGDYVTQSHWMATAKTQHWGPAWLHALLYGLPFAFLTTWPGVLVIISSHAVIDHYRMAVWVVWAKNQLAPAAHRPAWAESQPTGYGADVPPWLSVWLMILVDNTMHLAINALAVWWWPR